MDAGRDAQLRDTWRLAAWGVLVALLVAAGYGGRLTGGAPEADALYRYETAVGGAVVYAILLAVLLLIGRGVSRRELFALRSPSSWRRALAWAAGAYLAIFFGAGAILIALGAEDEQGLTPDEWDSSRLGQYAANFAVVAFVGPVVEELMYRGLGVTLLARWGSGGAVAVTAIGFGLGHGLLLALPALVWFGVVTALLRLRTRSVLPCIIVHCAFNATSLIVSVAL